MIYGSAGKGKETKEDLLNKCFETADKDRDGKLSYDELREWAIENKNLTSLTQWIFEEKQNDAQHGK